MASPESSLRRRGRGSVSEGTGHAKAESDGFGSFVDSSSAFPASFDQRLAEPLNNQATSSSVAFGSPTRTRSTSSAHAPRANNPRRRRDEWAEADMVSSFSPVESHFPKTTPSSSSKSATIASGSHQQLARSAAEVPRPNGQTGTLSWRLILYPINSRRRKLPALRRRQHRALPIRQMMPSSMLSK